MIHMFFPLILIVIIILLIVIVIIDHRVMQNKLETETPVMAPYTTIFKLGEIN